MRTLKLTSTAPQAAFHALTCKYPLFVGGYGCGKSETMINQAIMDASHSSDALIGLYAPSYDLVKLIIADRLCEKLEQLGIEYTYNKSSNTITTHTPGFGNFILRTLDNPAKMVGYETYRAHIDELDTLPMAKAQEVWQKLSARNRQQPAGIDKPFNRLCAYTTPEGYGFAYHRWTQNETDEEKALYQYVRAATASNPMLPPDYIPTLKATYPKELIRAYLEGKFTNLSSGTVYSSYDRKKHNSTETIQPNDVLYIGCDFNVNQMAATVYVRRNNGKEWHAVAELQKMLDTPDMLRKIKDRWDGHKIYMYPDGSGGNTKSNDASCSDIALIERAGYPIRAKLAKNSTSARRRWINPRVKDRIMATNAALDNGWMFVNALECPKSAKCLEQQAYDKNGDPDKMSGNDHQNDATTYVIAYEMPIRKPVAHIKVGFVV